MLIELRLVKAGYGSLRDIREMSAREVMQALHYEGYLNDYEAALWELNKK